MRPAGVADAPAGLKRVPVPWFLAASAALFVCAFLLSLSVGPTGITLEALPKAVGAAFGSAAGAREKLVLLDIRLPRTLIGAFVGASLGVAGTMMQGLFRNPLADPGLIGVSSGSALAAVATIAFGNTTFIPLLGPLRIYALPFAAFLGGAGATLALVGLTSRQGQLTLATLLLAGIGLGAFAGALTGLITYASNDQELRDLTLWSMGSLSGASWPKVFGVIPFLGIVLFTAPRLIRALNGLLLGEAQAFHLGIDVEAAKRTIVLGTAASVGAAVAVAGVIGFVGIVVPHLVRLLAGPDHAVVLPGSALVGATLLLAADVIARMVVAPAELPIGIVMAIIGAPVFLHLILRRGLAGAD